MTTSDLLQGYLDWDLEAAGCGDSEALRAKAEQLVREAGAGELTLLARNDVSLMVCAAAAALRQHATRVQRASIGRTGWKAPAGSILVEAVPPSAGLLATLRTVMAEGTVLVLSHELAEVSSVSVPRAA